MISCTLIFPGQGAQFVGMGKEFYETSPAARAIFDKADTLVSGLSEVMFNGPAEKLTSTAFCQPAIFTMSVAALEAFKASAKSSAFIPAFSCGLSLGEYPALVACGALSFESALKLVERRSAFMEEATKARKGAMAAVIGFEEGKLIEICRSTGAEVANFNAPDQIVITGDAEKVAAASKQIQEAGAKRVIPLEVSGAFHSSLMKSAEEKFRTELSKADIKSPRFPIISNVDAVGCFDPNQIRENLARQITSSVQWTKTIQYCQSQGVSTFLELGPGTVLKGLIRKINRELTVHNIQKPEDIEALPL